MEVPRPTSVQQDEARRCRSRTMAAASSISTMNVDSPRERGRRAPTRVKIPIDRRKLRARRGTKEPACARRTIVPPAAGRWTCPPCSAGDDEDPLSGERSDRSDEKALRADGCLTSGCRPSRMLMRGEAESFGRTSAPSAPAQRRRGDRVRRSTSLLATRRSPVPWRDGEKLGVEPGLDLAIRASAPRIFSSSSFSAGVAKRSAFARDWRRIQSAGTLSRCAARPRASTRRRG